MYTIETIIQCPRYYNLGATCEAHGWSDLAPFYAGRDSNELSFCSYVSGKAADFIVRQEGPAVSAAITTNDDPADTTEAIRTVTRVLSLDTDTSDLLVMAENAGARYEDLVKSGHGRVLRAPSAWEDAAKILFTTNCSWSMTKKICTSICTDRFSEPAPSGRFPFPGPESINALTDTQLKELLPVGYRAPFLKSLSRTFLRENPITDKEAILALDGFGPYACAHMLILMGNFNEIPTDTAVTGYLKETFGIEKNAAREFLDKRYRNWGENRWWGFRLESILNS